MSQTDSSKNNVGLVLVTGASGFLAAHVVKQLLEQGYRVRGTVRNLKDEKKVSPLRKLVENANQNELELVEADLLNESAWLQAVKDCTHVIHTASPFPIEQPSDENVLIKPAVDGTLFVLRACVQEGSKVQRVVLTSSVASIYGDNYKEGVTYTEKDWPDLNKISGYSKSKTLAEKAAWDFIKEREKNSQSCFELAVINPCLILGPMLTDTECSSCLIIKKMMKREIPFLPDVEFGICDVRDVALAHIKAMSKPECVSNRHIIATQVHNTTLQTMAQILDAEFKSKNYNVPTTVAPNFLMKFAGLFDKSIKTIAPLLGVKSELDNSRFLNVLEIKPIEIKKSLIDMANSMIERKLIP